MKLNGIGFNTIPTSVQRGEEHIFVTQERLYKNISS
jgi:hypothetical protein